MKKFAFYLFWTFMCLHTSVSFSDASSGKIESALAEIDTITAQGESNQANQKDSQAATGSTIELHAAPAGYIIPDVQKNVSYTPWEMIHRSAMIQGFSWTGSIANYITPIMYIGTPLQTNMSTLGYDEDLGPTNYYECIRMETTASFSLTGSFIEDSTEDELRNIAKYCAIEYLGTYFEGKKYTTREEMLMMLFTLFGENIGMPGHFEGDQFIPNGEEQKVVYSNISPRTWFGGYISLAHDYNMVKDTNTWKIAREVTDEDIELMFSMYLVDEEGEMIDGIETEYGTYYITYDEDRLTIKKVHKSATSTSNNTATGSQNITQPSRYPGCDTDDIVLPNGQVWAACNVGASKAGTGVESYGSLFQWGRNVPFSSTGSVKIAQGPLSYEEAMKTKDFIINGLTNPYDWLRNQNDNLWGSSLNDTSTTYSSATSVNKIKMHGICREGYHIPTYKEASNLIASLSTGSHRDYMTLLKIPAGGIREYHEYPKDSHIQNYWSYGSDASAYWWLASTSTYEHPSHIVGAKGFNGGQYIFWLQGDVRIGVGRNSTANTVRCLKN